MVFGFAIMLFAQPATAGSYLDFNMDGIHPDTANISFAGGASPLVGIDISVDSVAGIDTPANAGSYLIITGGILDFTTGNLISSTNNVWVFGGGGSITLSGNIGNGVVDLMSGQFSSATVEARGDTFRVTIASFTDSKNDALVRYFGFSPLLIDSWYGNMNLSFNTTAMPPSGFESSNVGSGDIMNNPIPEPGTLLLLGGGLLAVCAFVRRRK